MPDFSSSILVQCGLLGGKPNWMEAEWFTLWENGWEDEPALDPGFFGYCNGSVQQYSPVWANESSIVRCFGWCQEGNACAVRVSSWTKFIYKSDAGPSTLGP